MSNLQKEKEREKLGERERNRKCVSEEEREIGKMIIPEANR